MREIKKNKNIYGIGIQIVLCSRQSLSWHFLEQYGSPQRSHFNLAMLLHLTQRSAGTVC